MRLVPNFIRAISMICAARPTFMKSTPESNLQYFPCSHTMMVQATVQTFKLSSLHFELGSSTESQIDELGFSISRGALEMSHFLYTFLVRIP